MTSADLKKITLSYEKQVKADRRAAAVERRQAEIASDNARVRALYM